MTEPLTQAQLDEIRAAEAKATPGPWTQDRIPRPSGAISATIGGVSRQVAMATGDAPTHEAEPRGTTAEIMAWNAAFIAGARSWVPLLLAEIDRLNAALSASLEYQGQLEVSSAEYDRALNAACERREQLDASRKRVVELEAQLVSAQLAAETATEWRDKCVDLENENKRLRHQLEVSLEWQRALEAENAELERCLEALR